MKRLFALILCTGGCTLFTAFLPAPENEGNCQDDFDNDGDSLTDCQDSDCAAFVNCLEVCDNASDDDFDGLVDCDDFVDCGALPGCQRATGEPCSDSLQCLAASGNQAFCIPEEEGFARGYCSEACGASDACFVGSTSSGATSDGICLTGEESTLCFDQCDTDNDCREGYACFTGPDPDDLVTLVSVCLPKCTSDAQCPLTGRCNLDDNLCTTADEESVCDDSIDSDGDGFVDCADRGCLTDPVCQNVGEACEASSECLAFAGGDGFCLTESGFGFPDGYCIEACDIGLQDCAPGAICAPQSDNANETQGICLDDCQSNTDCRPGYGCLDPDDAGPVGTICLPQCGAVDECSETGRCNPDTGLCCNTDPETKECVGFDPEACGTNADEDLDSSFDCGDLECSADPACQPSQIVGDACTGSVQCLSPTGASDPVCLDEANTGFPGGYCSSFCDLEGADLCGTEALCANVSGTELCLARCDAVGDLCRDGYACTPVGLDFACTPLCVSDEQCPITQSCELLSGFCR